MGSSIDVLHEALKIAHTYTFLTKNFYGFETVFLHYDFGIFPTFYMRIMQSENFATYVHAHYMGKNFAPDIYENCGAFETCVRLIERWYLGVRLYHVLYVRSSFG